MIKLFYKTNLKSAEKESILINLFSIWILLFYRKIWVFAVFLIKLYSKATPISTQTTQLYPVQTKCTLISKSHFRIKNSKMALFSYWLWLVCPHWTKHFSSGFVKGKGWLIVKEYVGWVPKWILILDIYVKVSIRLWRFSLKRTGQHSCLKDVQGLERKKAL